jgi:hypothetical protein
MTALVAKYSPMAIGARDRVSVIFVALSANGASSYRDAHSVVKLCSARWQVVGCDILTDRPELIPTTDLPKRVRVHRVASNQSLTTTLSNTLRGAPGDSKILFCISSHGYIATTSHAPHEVSGYSEYVRVGSESFFDFELTKLLAECTPRTCTLFALLDTCHSGTLIDMPFLSTDGVSMRQANCERGMPMPGVCISACSDTELNGEDISDYGGWGGKLMCAFLDSLATNSTVAWLGLYQHVRTVFTAQRSQRSHPVFSATF